MNAEYAANLVVEQGFVGAPFIQRRGEGGGEAVVVVVLTAAHFQVEPVVNRLFDDMRSAPIRNYRALESPFVLENVDQQDVVVTAPLTVQLVVGAHDRQNARFLYGTLECNQEQFAQRAFVGANINGGPSPFVAVADEVLDVCRRALPLNGRD